MLPTEQQVKDAAPKIAAFMEANRADGYSLLIADQHGIWVPYYFCSCYTQFDLKKSDFETEESDDFFQELLIAINKHTPEPYTVFWHEGALFYGDENAFFDEWTTDPDTTEPTSNNEPF